MKKILFLPKQFLFAFLLIFITCSCIQKAHAFGDIYPFAQVSFTGKASACENSDALLLTFSFSTKNCGSGNLTPVPIVVTWYENSINSTSGGSIVHEEYSDASTTVFQYHALTSIAGFKYYYVEVTWGPVGIYCTLPGSLTSNEAQEIFITKTGLWLGVTESRSWNDSDNWCGGIPTSTTDVRIPVLESGKYPIVSDAVAEARDLKILEGASLMINKSEISIAGSISNKGELDITNGTLTINGTTGSQYLVGSMFKNNTVKYLRIGNSAGVKITGTNDTLKISGILSFTKSNCDLTIFNNLTILSNAGGTASIADMTNKGVDSGNVIIGNVTVERYIPNHTKAWQLLAVPTKESSVRDTWQEGNGTLSNENNPGYGTIITSNLPNAINLGFDIYTASGSTIKTYNSATDEWEGISSTFIPINNKKGYMLFVRGDRSVTAFNQSATATTLRTYGNLYTTGTEAPPSTTVEPWKYQSVGNPYASAINFDKVIKTGGLLDQFYVWDPRLTNSMNSAYGYGAFQTFVGPGPNYLVVPGGGSYEAGNTNIESGQAFFVAAGDTEGTIAFAESSKTEGSNIVTRENNSLAKLLRCNLYVLKDGLPILIDGNICQYEAGYSNSIDLMDVAKLKNSTESFSILREGKKLVAERRAEITTTDTLFFNIDNLMKVDYEFVFTSSNFNTDGYVAFFEDAFLNKSTVVKIYDTTRIKVHVINDPASYAADRFRLVVHKLAPTPVLFAGVTASLNTDKSISIHWKVEQELQIVTYTVERSNDGRNFTGIITIPSRVNNGGRAEYDQTDKNPLPADNFYRIRAVGQDGHTLYSNTVKAPFIKVNPGISVYPNPVRDQKMHVQIIDQPAGRYRMHLINSNGALLQVWENQLPSGFQNIPVLLPPQLAPGLYMLRIAGPDGKDTIHRFQVIN